MNKAESGQIIILGMHRSGTSALTGALSGMGLFVGEADDLTQPLTENPRGFFERRDARRVCDSLLHDAGADWWKVSGFDADSFEIPLADRHREPILDLLNELDGHGRWALKEPRLCLLFPLIRPWLQKPLVVVVVRHPLEVAKSLRLRNGFPIRVGLALWEIYTLSALRSASSERHYLIRHSKLLSDPRGELKRLAGWLSDNGVAGLDVVGGAAMIEPSLRHQRHSNFESDTWMPGSVTALWESLERDDDIDSLPAPSTQALWTLQEFEADHEAELARTAETRKLRKQLKEFKTECSDLNEQLTAASNRKEGASPDDSVALEKLRVRYERALKDSRHRVNELRERLDGAEGYAKTLERRLRMQDATIGGLCGRLEKEAEGDPSVNVNWFDRVTVCIIAVFKDGSAEAVSDCLEGLRRQSWPRWELIVVHDPARFGGGEGLSRLSDPRIRLVGCSDANEAEALNRGIEACSGELVAYWRGKPGWRRNFLASAVAAFQARPEASAFLNEQKGKPAEGLESLVHRRAMTDCFGPLDYVDDDGELLNAMLRKCVSPILLTGGSAVSDDDRPVFDAALIDGIEPRFRRIRLIIGPELLGRTYVDQWKQAFGSDVEVEVTAWASGSATEAEGIASYSLASADEVLKGMGESLSNLNSDWVIALGHSPIARLQALLSHYHCGCPVAIVSSPVRAGDAEALAPLQREIESLVSKCVERIRTSDAGVCPAILIADEHWLEPASTSLPEKLAFLGRVQSPADRLSRAVEQLAMEFSAWRNQGSGAGGKASGE